MADLHDQQIWSGKLRLQARQLFATKRSRKRRGRCSNVRPVVFGHFNAAVDRPDTAEIPTIMRSDATKWPPPPSATVILRHQEHSSRGHLSVMANEPSQSGGKPVLLKWTIRVANNA